MQCTVRNETQFDIIYQDNYFDSGTYYEAPPQKIDKFSHGNFSACNKWGLAGMSGGNWWKLILDDKNVFKFSLVRCFLFTPRIESELAHMFSCQGYTDPVIGSRKSAAVESDGDPKDGYNAATERGASGRSTFYKGVDKDGNETWFLIEVTSVTGHHSVFTVRQNEIKGWQDP